MGDYDRQGDVNLVDYALFADCLGGPAAKPIGVSCCPGDDDRDVDLRDFRAFQLAYTG